MSLLRILGEKPWDEQGAPEEGGQLAAAPQKTALFFFLGIVTVLFGLFFAAYYIRMALDDWRPLPEPGLLWLNTAVLAAASVILQWTRNGLARGDERRLQRGLLLGGLATFGFIAGQVAAWSELNAAGYYLNSNPANSFFYVLTGLHALHMLGGLWVWTRAALRLGSGAGAEAIRVSVELCTVYWHFLLLVWLVLFGLLSYT